MPVVDQPENEVTAEELAALEAEEFAIFGMPAKYEPMQARLFPKQEVA